MVATPCLLTYTVPILEARPAEHSDAREAETSTGTVPSIGVKGLTRLQDYTLLRLSLPNDGVSDVGDRAPARLPDVLLAADVI
jgi:hypothetical protein